MNSRRVLILHIVVFLYYDHASSSNITSETIIKEEEYKPSLNVTIKTKKDQAVIFNLTSQTVDVGNTLVTKNTIEKFPKILKNVPKRRTVLIINSASALRSRIKSKKSSKVDSLLYEERDKYGNKTNTFMMRNMKDVAKFFEVYLDTEICHGECEGD